MFAHVHFNVEIGRDGQSPLGSRMGTPEVLDGTPDLRVAHGGLRGLRQQGDLRPA